MKSLAKSMPKPTTGPRRCGGSSIRRSPTSLGRTARLSTFPRIWSSGSPHRIERWNAQLQRLLPAGAYAQAASILAGTSRREYDDFIDQVRAYRGQIITFLEDRDAFGSREWFNDDEGWRADLRDLPRFHERGRTVAESLSHAWPAALCDRDLCRRQSALHALRRYVSDPTEGAILMLAAIVKRELIDHLISLRFGLALVLTVGFMVLNALGFVGLGLWVSIRSSTTRSSLVGVLLLWTCGVLLWPATGGALAARVLVSEFEERLILGHGFAKQNTPAHQRLIHLKNRLRNRDLRNPEKVRQFKQDREDRFLAHSLGEVENTRHIVRLSPTGCFQYGMEALAGTGLARHKSFVEQARTYVQQFEQTMLNLDRGDPKSMHIHLVAQGLSRQKIDPDTLPVFYRGSVGDDLAAPRGRRCNWAFLLCPSHVHAGLPGVAADQYCLKRCALNRRHVE